MKNLNKTGLYIHYPFCISKCAYCDFNSVAAKEVNQDDVLTALLRDLKYYHELVGNRTIDTIYFGGGTPSLMPASMVKKILDEVHTLFNVKDGAEITIEANPLTAEIDKFEGFKKAGINRISLGVQSFSDKGLKTLGRAHNVEQAEKALVMAKNTFKRSSFDLIYGWKGQTLADWKEELQKALQYENGHLSIYQLTIYEGTPLAKTGAKEISDEQSLLFQETAIKILGSKGIDQYEISNYAREREESQHNLIYWHYDDYMGIGAGASGRITVNGNKTAFKNETDINKWLKSCSPQKETLTQEKQFEEYLLMGLRLNKGINISDFKTKTGKDISSILDGKEFLSEFIKIDNGYLVASKSGRNCLDTLLIKLV